MGAGHGLGHATRVIEVSRHLLDAGHAVTVVSGAALARHTRHFPPDRFSLRAKVLDCGAKQVPSTSPILDVNQDDVSVHLIDLPECSCSICRGRCSFDAESTSLKLLLCRPMLSAWI